ncbi:MAG TPA: cache domain-containing protein, partial [Spirochaetota bacterium]
MKFRWTLNYKFSAMTGAFIFLFILIVALSANLIVSRMMSHYFENEVKSQSLVAGKMIEEMKDRALASTAWFENSPRLIAVMKAKDHDGIVTIGSLAMKSLGLEFFVVTDKEGNVLARANAPDQSGENIAAQPNIQKALAGEKSVGIEQGPVVKYSICAGTPIRDERGNILGALSIGFVFAADKFVDSVKELTGCEATVFSGDTRVNTTLIRNGERLVGTKMEHKEILDKVLGKGEPYYSQATILGKLYYTAYLPIKDVNQTTSGMFFIGRDANVGMAIVRNLILYQILILSVVGALFFLMMVIGVRRYIIKQIARVSRQMHEIAQGDGDLTVRLAVRSEDEVSDMIKDFNMFVDKMHDVVKTMADLSSSLSASAEEMSAATTSFSDNAQSQA